MGEPPPGDPGGGDGNGEGEQVRQSRRGVCLARPGTLANHNRRAGRIEAMAKRKQREARQQDIQQAPEAGATGKDLAPHPLPVVSAVVEVGMLTIDCDHNYGQVIELTPNHAVVRYQDGFIGATPFEDLFITSATGPGRKATETGSRSRGVKISTASIPVDRLAKASCAPAKLMK